MNKTISVRMEEVLLDELQAIALERRRTLSDLCRLMLEAYARSYRAQDGGAQALRLPD